jgi:ribosomal protein S4
MKNQKKTNIKMYPPFKKINQQVTPLYSTLNQMGFKKKKENFSKSFLSKNSHKYMTPKLVKLFRPKLGLKTSKGLQNVTSSQKYAAVKNRKQTFLKKNNNNKFSFNKKNQVKKKVLKYRQKASFRYVRLLKKFVLYPKKLRTRFLFKLMLITKKAFLQYYRRFSLKNFDLIKKLYRSNIYKLTKFEKFVMFFEMRLTCNLVRLHYAKYILYANFLILTGQIRVNGNIISLCDYQIKIFDLIEISYMAFYRQFFKKFIYRRFFHFHRKVYGTVYRYRSKYCLFYLKKKLKKLPRWLFYTVTRLFKTSPAYILLSRSPTNDYFIQSNRALATIIYKPAFRFNDRKLSYFMTKKHMKFVSNFCTSFN